MIPAIMAGLEAVGSAGAAVGAGEATAGLVAANESLGKVQGSMSRLNPSLRQFADTVTMLPSKLLEAKSVITSTFSTFVNGLAAPADAVKEMGDAISRFVRLSNPAAIQQFEYRIENMFASIGRIVEPIMSALGRAADKMNEGFSKLAPALGTIVDAVDDLIDSTAEGIVPAFRELAPLIQASILPLRGFAGLIQMATAELKLLQAIGLTNPLKMIFGGFNEEAQKAVAARQVRMTTAENAQREGAKAAIQASYAAATGEKKPETTENLLEKIYNFLEANVSFEKLKQLIQEFIKGALPELPKVANAPGNAAGRAVDIARNPFGVLDFIR